MSLFQVQEWFRAVFPNAHSLCVAGLVGGREQLVVGTLDGILSVLDPGKGTDHREQLPILAELQLGRPILQLAVDNFLPSNSDEPILAALLPNSLLFFRLVQNNDSFVCEQVFEHRIAGPPAFNMCKGHFGHSSILQLCVQSIQGHLHFFEAENRVLQRPLPDILHPGPIGYSSTSESLLIASGGFLRSLRYVSLTATGTKKINLRRKKIDWSLPLGDHALQMVVLNVSASASVQPSALVLCKRMLHCITHGGNPRYTIRLQTVALCFGVLGHAKDAHIHLFIGTASKTLLFYSDTQMMWSAQLPFASQHVDTCTFSESLRSLLALLSDDGNLLIGYLGTEPSLFRMPVTESRFIDFEVRKKELREFEEIIWKNSRENIGKGDQLGVEANIEMDDISEAFNATDEGIPSATVTITFQDKLEETTRPTSTVLFQSELYSTQGTQFSILPEVGRMSLKTFCHQQPVLDPRCQLLISSNGLRFVEFSAPLLLICREAATQRQATFKLSLESNKAALDISTLFPEFSRNQDKTSLGLQPFFGDQSTTVSVFVSAKTNRYRIQSDSTNFLYAVFASLIERIQRLQPDARLRCPIPMHLFLEAIAKHIEAENQNSLLEKEACRLSIQMRHVETVLLSKLKASDREQPQQQTHVNTLLEYTYRELASVLDKMGELQQRLSESGRQPIRSLFNLINVIFRLNGLNLPFDGQILDGTDQKLSERISQLLFAPEETLMSAELGVAELGQMLANLCEQSGGKLEGIAEEEEEDEEQRQENDQKELKEAIEKSEASLGLLDLESGSLPARQLNEGI